MAMASHLRPVVSEILFREWDPIGVNENDECRDEYEAYVTAVVQWLLSGADESRLASGLGQIQQVGMGMSVIDEALHRRGAQAPRASRGSRTSAASDRVGT
ncbi:MAG: hypothetical protein U0790_21550 [Isosphaeraceae bacterium]